MKTTNAQALFNLLSQVILQGTNFVLIILFTRFMSTDDYGIVSIYQAYVMFFSAFMGLNIQGSIGTAFVHLDADRHKEYLSNILLISLASFAVILGISSLLLKPLVSFSQLPAPLIYLMLGHSMGSFCFSFWNIKCVYSRTAQYSCLMACIIAGAMILMSVLAILGDYEKPYLGRVLALAVPYIVCGVCVIGAVFWQSHSFQNFREYARFCLPICLPLIFHSISQIVLAQTDKIMLQKILEDHSTVGIYAFTVTFSHVLNSIYTALNNTWTPVYYDYLKLRKLEHLRERAARYINIYTMLASGFILVAPEFIKVLAAPEYQLGIPLLPLAVLSIYMVFLYSFPVNYEFYLRKTKWIAVGTTLAALCNIIVNAALIPVFGMYGAAAATLLAYVLLAVFHGLCAKRLQETAPVPHPFSIGFFLKGIAIICLFCCLFYLFLDQWYVRWALAVMVGGMILIHFKKHRQLF